MCSPPCVTSRWRSSSPSRAWASAGLLNVLFPFSHVAGWPPSGVEGQSLFFLLLGVSWMIRKRPHHFRLATSPGGGHHWHQTASHWWVHPGPSAPRLRAVAGGGPPDAPLPPRKRPGPRLCIRPRHRPAQRRATRPFTIQPSHSRIRSAFLAVILAVSNNGTPK